MSPHVQVLQSPTSKPVACQRALVGIARVTLPTGLRTSGSPSFLEHRGISVSHMQPNFIGRPHSHRLHSNSYKWAAGPAADWAPKGLPPSPRHCWADGEWHTSTLPMPAGCFAARRVPRRAHQTVTPQADHSRPGANQCPSSDQRHYPTIHSPMIQQRCSLSRTSRAADVVRIPPSQARS